MQPVEVWTLVHVVYIAYLTYVFLPIPWVVPAVSSLHTKVEALHHTITLGVVWILLNSLQTSDIQL